jgi:hypothetical protein
VIRVLQIRIPEQEFWNERTEKFSYKKGCSLKLEHSLISISKWEAIWHVSFFDTKLSEEQLLSYIQCMSLGPEIDLETVLRLTQDNIKEIVDYMKDPMTASSVKESKGPQQRRRERITSEYIYYLMIRYNIPDRYDQWHINRLIMLIRICSAKEAEANPQKKTNSRELMREYDSINERNKARFNTRG